MNKQKIPILIRSVNLNDVHQLYDLFNSLSETDKRFFHPHSFDIKTITTICTSGKDHFFVMLYEGRIIGYSMLRLFGSKIPSFGCCIHIEYQKKGYGLELTKWTIQQARNLGYKKIILKTYKNNLPAVTIYQKAGFIITGEKKDTNEILMELVL